MTGLVLAGSALAPVAAGGAWLYYACSWPRSQVLGPALVRGPEGGRRVALTFDDGPAPPFTSQILDILARERVPAAFFVCGKNVERFPEIVGRIQAEGHTLGNHTFSHPLFYFKGRARIEYEIDRTQKAVEGVTGRRPRLFRPPYGVRWFGLFQALGERGLTAVQWSDTGYDWKPRHGSAEIARRALRRLRGGSVILLHDGREPRSPGEVDASSTVAALPAILEGARAAGFRFVPIEQFLSSP
jgi:peptidoglycan-N-acetylglucosamine deacetylase